MSTVHSDPKLRLRRGSPVPHLQDNGRSATATEPRSEPMSRLATLLGVQVLGTGGYTPDVRVHNEDLSALGCDPEWIVQRSGISERRHAPTEQASGDLAYEAAIRCIDSAGVDPADIDLLIVGTITPDRQIPSTACELQDRLGLRCPSMDIAAACAGFMYSSVTAMQFIHSGASRHALVVASDVLTRVVDPKDKRTYPLFGDGAGAALLGRGDENQGFLAYTLGSDGAGADQLCIPGGGSREPLTAESIAAGDQYLYMDGRSIFKWAVRTIHTSCYDVLDHAGLTVDDIDWVMLHQANSRILDAAVEDMGLDRHKVLLNLDRYGNTSAASIPLVLDEAARDGLLTQGDRILMCGFGAGLTWGTGILQW